MQIKIALALLIAILGGALYWSVQQIGELKEANKAVAREAKEKVEAAEKSVSQWKEAAKNAEDRVGTLDKFVTEKTEELEKNRQAQSKAIAKMTNQIQRLQRDDPTNCLLATVHPAVDERLLSAENPGGTTTAPAGEGSGTTAEPASSVPGT